MTGPDPESEVAGSDWLAAGWPACLKQVLPLFGSKLDNNRLRRLRRHLHQCRERSNLIVNKRRPEMTIWVVIPECGLYLISHCWIIVWTTLHYSTVIQYRV